MKVDLTRSKCEEASPLSVNMYIPCGRPAVEVISHNKDRRAYRMCEGCADHNVTNRGGIRLVAAKDGADLEKQMGEALQAAWDYLGTKGTDRPAMVDKKIMDALEAFKKAHAAS